MLAVPGDQSLRSLRAQTSRTHLWTEMSFPDQRDLKKMLELITLANRLAPHSNKPVVPGTLSFLCGQPLMDSVDANDSSSPPGSSLPQAVGCQVEKDQVVH